MRSPVMFFPWRRSWLKPSRPRARRPGPARTVRPTVEVLEARTLLDASPSAMQTFLATPLVFQPNVGQAAPGTAFVAQGPGLSVGLTPTAATLALAATPADTLTMRLVGA